MQDENARAWLHAARTPRILQDLDHVYTQVAHAINAQRPACWGSGRCCNFAKSDHLLFVTGLEAACTYTRACDAGSAITLEAVDRARNRGDCPWLVACSCSVHTIKPLGCRVYFCDRTSSAWQSDLTESALASLRALHEMHSIPYEYAEWRSLLTRVVQAGDAATHAASAIAPGR